MSVACRTLLGLTLRHGHKGAKLHAGHGPAWLGCAVSMWCYVGSLVFTHHNLVTEAAGSSAWPSTWQPALSLLSCSSQAPAWLPLPHHQLQQLFPPVASSCPHPRVGGGTCNLQYGEWRVSQGHVDTWCSNGVGGCDHTVVWYSSRGIHVAWEPVSHPGMAGLACGPHWYGPQGMWPLSPLEVGQPWFSPVDRTLHWVSG